MRTDEFIPGCPTCDYDLRGTPASRCPECGNSFNRAEVFDPHRQLRRKPTWPNYLLAAAIVASMFGWGFRQPYAEAKSLVQLAIIWLLAFGWVALRRNEIFGTKPYLVLWLLLVALFAPNRPNIEPPAEHWVNGFSAIVALAVFGYAFIRRPIDSGKYMLYAIAFATAFMGLMLVLVGGLAAILAPHDGVQKLYGFEIPAGPTRVLVTSAVGILHLLTAAVIYWLARRIVHWQARRG